MEPAKLQFSAHEMNLVTDAGWILTKNEILNKIKELLGELHIAQKNLLTEQEQPLPGELLRVYGKISRGENYQGLPYLVLDYPRNFTRHNIFAIRSMFWWGNTLSTTLHLSGKWQQFYADKILNNYHLMAQKNFVIATGDNEWVHDVTGAGYTPTSAISFEELKDQLVNRPFFKIALHYPVSYLNESVNSWTNQFKNIIKVLC